MKKSAVIFFVFSLCLGLTVFAQDEEYIKWSSDRQITWDDFKGDCSDISFFGAQISRGISFSCTTLDDGECEYLLYSYVNPSKSCFKLKSDKLLKHERTHFDICEYAVRVYRKNIKQYIDTVEMVDCATILAFEDEMWEFEEELQNQYDRETNYSRDEAKQEEWTQKVKKWLEELKEYAEPVSE